MKTIKYIYNKVAGTLFGGLCLLGVLFVNTSCEDMLDKGNDYVIYADDQLINERAEMNTSLLGILNKLQAVAVRNNLLGEVRADLVVLNSNASNHLKDMASLDINNDDDNIYNSPADYYAVINNCNYFLTHVDSLAADVDGTKYFEAEVAQVHSIRAWTYLQLVLAYGEVPFVTEPVLTSQQADESRWPKARLTDVCTFFINDLKPYIGKLYSESFTVDGVINSELCFFPTQLVMGDLYLWRAAKTQSSADALEAAKYYYQYLVWDKKKQYTYMSNARCAWKDDVVSSGSLRANERNITNTISYGYSVGTSNLSSGWTSRSQECITAIPMDSASSVGYYNDLRRLYNTTQNEDNSYEEAKISPSDQLRELSQAQTYIVRYNGQNYKLEKNLFTEDEIKDGFLGDLRYHYNYSQSSFKYNSKEVQAQTIRKHINQHITIYRTSQIYLRLAEALNYAGYPRMARQLLTMGLSDNVIAAEVLPYYQTAQDSANIQYFSFPTLYFRPYASSYVQRTNKFGQVVGTMGMLTIAESDCNMWGLHSRGAGMTCYNTDYAPLAVLDSTDYPRTEEAAVGDQPAKTDAKYNYPDEPAPVTKPSTWDKYPGVTDITEAQYRECNSGAVVVLKKKYKDFVANDSVGKYKTYVEVDMPAYEAAVAAIDLVFDADVEAYNGRVKSFVASSLAPWSSMAYQRIVPTEQKQIDQLILDEQALEMAFEGNRFFDLMRRAMWYADASKLSAPISKRDASVGAKLNTESNWYLKWNGKIGL